MFDQMFDPQSKTMPMLFLALVALCWTSSESSDTAGHTECQVESTAKCDYTLRPLTNAFGAEIEGINVGLLDKECAGKLKQEAYMHRLLLFKNQDISWQEQVRFTEFLGSPFSEVSSINRKKHKKTPDHRVGMFSNDPNEGLTAVGIEGWHVDGNVASLPHAFTLIYCIKANKNGPTLLVPLREIAESLSEEERSYLESLQFVSAFNSTVIHPLIYKNPNTDDDTIFLALGKLSGQYLQTFGDGAEPRVLSVQETQYIQDILEGKILGSNLIYSHQYDDKDLLILQNQAIAHIAGPGSQSAPSVSGLRLMRRSTVLGDVKPSKKSKVEYRCLDIDSDGNSYCLFSLKNSVYYPQIGKFDALDVARQRCRIINKYADIAVIKTEDVNKLAAEIISKTKVPHWLNASNPNGKDVFWNGEKSEFTNWDQSSGQPNDCDGPEVCVVMGPFGHWFDVTCGPKTKPGSDAGPVMTWEDGTRQMYNVYPLCGVDKKYL